LAFFVNRRQFLRGIAYLPFAGGPSPASGYRCLSAGLRRGTVL
jgi:hypothetical protein